MIVRPTGLVVVHVAGGPIVKARVQVWPLTTVVSVCAVRLSGSAGLLSVTLRLVVVVLVTPLMGSVVVTVLATGTCIPNRGSGPPWYVVRVPSGDVTLRLPSAFCWST